MANVDLSLKSYAYRAQWALTAKPAREYNESMKNLRVAGLILALAAPAMATDDVVFEMKDKESCYKAAVGQIKNLSSDSDEVIVTRKPDRQAFSRQAARLCQGANNDAPVVCHRAAFPVIRATAGYYARAASEQAVELCRGARMESPLAPVECFQSGVETVAAFNGKKEVGAGGKSAVLETVGVCAAGNLNLDSQATTATR